MNDVVQPATTIDCILSLGKEWAAHVWEMVIAHVHQKRFSVQRVWRVVMRACIILCPTLPSKFGQGHSFRHSLKILVSHFHDFATQHQFYFKNTDSC